MALPAGLYVVATPIGNMGDLSARARDVLAQADVVAAEDTRHTANLLRLAGLDRPLVSLHEHNEAARVPEIIARLQRGERVALVSDAGTPLVSDPGFRLVRAARDAGLDVHAVPGPCAAIAALSVAGMPCDRFCFEGFLPVKAAARREQLARLAGEARTLVFYEAPHRLQESLADLAQAFGGAREAVVARELTKAFESAYHGSLEQLVARASADADMSRGEIVIIVAGAGRVPAVTDAELDRVLGVLLKSMPVSEAAGVAAELTGARRNACYARAVELKDSFGRGP